MITTTGRAGLTKTLLKFSTSWKNLDPATWGRNFGTPAIEAFEAEIGNGKTIVVAGPIGKFEDPGHKLGTERVYKKIAETRAFKVAGGGETHKAITTFGLEKYFNWLSVGGGAALEFLAKGTLPGIEALIH